jgi:hypothetical protein
VKTKREIKRRNPGRRRVEALKERLFRLRYAAGGAWNVEKLLGASSRTLERWGSGERLPDAQSRALLRLLELLHAQGADLSRLANGILEVRDVE